MKWAARPAAAMFFAVLAVSALAEEEGERLARRAFKHAAVVEVDGKVAGTAVPVRHGGKVLYMTCAHVAKPLDPITGKLRLAKEKPDGSLEKVPAKVLRQADVEKGEPDLALLEVTEGSLDLEIAELATEPPVAGQPVYHAGACFGKISYMQGHVSRAKYFEAGQEYVQLSSMLAPGSSGGPVFEKNGKLLGVSHSTVPGFASWCIPASVIRAWLGKKPDKK